jgi:acyl carrier protein
LVYPEAIGWELLPTYPWQHESYWISESYETLTAAHPSQPGPKELTTTQEKPSDLLGTVTSAVADILGIPSERVRTEQHMFEIGMDSISAVRLINDLKKKHGIAFTLPDLLREENIEQLVQWLEMNPSNTHEVESVNSLSDEEWDTDFIDQISESDVRALEEVIRKESLQ